MQRAPLVWGMGLAFGSTLAAVLGAYIPSWGVALAIPGANLLLGLGLRFAPESDEVPVAMRIALALSTGFVVTTIPLTLFGLGELVRSDIEVLLPHAVRTTAALRAELVPLWAVMVAGLAIGAAGLRFGPAKRR